VICIGKLFPLSPPPHIAVLNKLHTKGSAGDCHPGVLFVPFVAKKFVKKVSFSVMQGAGMNPYKGMKINKNFKDSLFTKLFSDADLLRDLYCALGGVTLPQDVPVSINTLENVLFMDLYNDISFEIGGKLIILIEHQSLSEISDKLCNPRKYIIRVDFIKLVRTMT